MHIDPLKNIAKDARILIVDDEKKNISLLAGILSHAGYGICMSITDPRKAVAVFGRMEPDLLLLDWHMGELSGLDVLNEIRGSVPEELMCPVLVLTADDSPRTRREALGAGVTDFLSKPLDYSEVLLRIRNLLMLRMFALRERSERNRLEELVCERTSELGQALADLKESQHQVVQQERLRALGSMAGGIAHDFNNVLTVIQGYADMFQERETIVNGPDAALQAFGIVRKAAADGSEIVRRLREFYRPYKRGEDDHRPVDLREIVKEAVQLSIPRWRTQTQAAGIFTDVRMDLGDVPEVPGAASELREVVINLIFNAVDAMPVGGQIVVSTGVEEDRVFIDVSDSGTGMDEQTRRHCLEPFFTTKGDRGGTGLGLATAYGIVRRHGGIIRVDSQVGQGTRFTILLPMKRADESPAPAKAGESAAPGNPSQNFPPGGGRATGGAIPPPAVKPTWASAPLEPPARASRAARVPPHSLRVLVVDDHAEICRVLRYYLEGDDHLVETASGGREALEKFRDSQFDIVITDRDMPQMTGDQLASAIKGLHPGEPVILLTSFARDQEQFSPDIDLMLKKPASRNNIRQAIKRVMTVQPG